MDNLFSLTHFRALVIRQRRELAEFFGFETRNKYEVLDEHGALVAFAAEQQKGFIGMLFRHLLGHWRSFQIHFFSPQRQPVLVVNHPFRFFFQRLEISDNRGKAIGAVQQRFSILTRRFEVEDAHGRVIMEVSSPIFKMWTFPFIRDGREVAVVRKQWSGLFTEIFSDKDNFGIEFPESSLSNADRNLILAAAMFIDLQYFEKKSSN